MSGASAGEKDFHILLKGAPCFAALTTAADKTGDPGSLHSPGRSSNNGRIVPRGREHRMLWSQCSFFAVLSHSCCSWLRPCDTKYRFLTLDPRSCTVPGILSVLFDPTNNHYRTKEAPSTQRTWSKVPMALTNIRT